MPHVECVKWRHVPSRPDASGRDAMTTHTLKSRLVAQAETEGFVLAGICRPDAVPGVAERLAEFLSEGRHGQMGWMAERAHWRGDPAALWPQARSVVMLAEPYTPGEDPLATLDRPDRATISVYARNRDYHDLLKKRLKRLARWLIAEAGGEVKVFVDTAPVPEKALGQAAGVGWQGKHTNLLSRDLGNWFFLGAIFTTLELEPDAPEVDHCGSCRACLDVCPTDAFRRPTSSTRGGAFPTSRSSTKDRWTRNCAHGWATGSTAATTASPSVRGTSSRWRRGRSATRRVRT